MKKKAERDEVFVPLSLPSHLFLRCLSNDSSLLISFIQRTAAVSEPNGSDFYGSSGRRNLRRRTRTGIRTEQIAH